MSTEEEGLEEALDYISRNPCPPIAAPSRCSKRASVALILRIQPASTPGPRPDSVRSVAELGAHSDPIQSFFSQPWVRQGHPEVLFIVRAARANDRWTNQVALPGGKHDPNDSDDRATAVRETWEEVGLDLDGENFEYVGNLPERVITTSWGRIPLMVLCPFVFISVKHTVPALKLHGAEVASAHWVPLWALHSSSLRTSHRCDVNDRLARRGGFVTKTLLRLMFGQMVFAAIKLPPTESLYFSSSAGPTTKQGQRESKILPEEARLPLLWGITLGIITDFMHLLPSANTARLWQFPTFGALDVRFVLWMISYSFRKAKRQQLEDGTYERGTAQEDLHAATRKGGAISGYSNEGKCNDRNVSYAPNESLLQTKRTARSSAVGHMLKGYYDIVRKAAALTLFMRATLASGFLLRLLMWYRRRQRSKL